MNLRVGIALLLGATCLVAGCGGDDAPTSSAERVVQRFAKAVNDGDWTRACELSVPDARCERLLRRVFSGKPRPRLVVAGIEGSSDASRVVVAEGPGGFSATVERHDGKWLVHPEVQTIR